MGRQRNPHELRKALESLAWQTGEGVDFGEVIIEFKCIDDLSSAAIIGPEALPNDLPSADRAVASPESETCRDYFQSVMGELRAKYGFIEPRVA